MRRHNHGMRNGDVTGVPLSVLRSDVRRQRAPEGSEAPAPKMSRDDNERTPIGSSDTRLVNWSSPESSRAGQR